MPLNSCGKIYIVFNICENYLEPFTYLILIQAVILHHMLFVAGDLQVLLTFTLNVLHQVEFVREAVASRHHAERRQGRHAERWSYRHHAEGRQRQRHAEGR